MCMSMMPVFAVAEGEENQEPVECGHANVVQVEGKDPTCTEDGNYEYYCCQDCGACCADAAFAENVYADNSAFIRPAAGHVWDEGEETVPATCLQAGEKTCTCTVEGCGATKTEPVAATGHKYGEDGKCTVCGAEIPVQASNDGAEVTYVAQIGETGYETLADAVAAANTAGTATIKLVADFNITYTGNYATISNGSDITIDLNGKTVVAGTTADSGTSLFWVSYGGKLTVTDTSTGATGHITTGANPSWIYDGGEDFTGSYASNLISNRGTLVVNAGTLENVCNGSAAYVIDAASASTTTINGGLVKAYNTAVRVASAYSNTGKAVLNLNGGEINGYDGIWAQVGGDVNGIEVNVTGGKITGDNEDGWALYDYCFDATFKGPVTYNISGGVFDAAYSLFTYGADVNISGGTFPAEVWLYVNRQAENTVTVTGGNFGSSFCVYDYTADEEVHCGTGIHFANEEDALAYCPDGYEVVELTEDDEGYVKGYPYTLMRSYAAAIGTVKYETLAEAVAAANTAGTATITLLSNFNISYTGNYATINNGSDITIDLNGKNVVAGTTASDGTSLFLVNYGGKLTFTDTSTGATGHITNGAEPTWIYDGSGNYAGSYASNLITNKGTLVVNAGTLENIAGGSAAYAIDAHSASTTTINGGLVKAFNTAVRVASAYSNTGKATFTLNGGEIYGYQGIWVQVGSDVNGVDINVTGGKITCRDKNGNVSGYALYDYCDAATFPGTVTYNISGGVFDAYYDSIFTYGADVNITDGTFLAPVFLYVNRQANNTVTQSGGYFGSYFYVRDYTAGYNVLCQTGGYFANAADAAYCCADGYEVVLLSEGDEGYVADYPYVVRIAVPDAVIIEEKTDEEVEQLVTIDDGETTPATQEETEAAVEAVQEAVDNEAVTGMTPEQTGIEAAVDEEKVDANADSILKYVDVSLVAAEVKTESLEEAVTATVVSMSFDVKPMATVVTDGQLSTEVIPNEAITAPITFRLPVGTNVTASKAEVKHEGTSIGYYDVKTENGVKFIELSAMEFSIYSYEILSGVETDPAAAIGTTGYASLADAIAAVQSGQTITLLVNAEMETAAIPENVTLSLGTYTVSGKIILSSGAKAVSAAALAEDKVGAVDGCVVILEQSGKNYIYMAVSGEEPATVEIVLDRTYAAAKAGEKVQLTAYVKPVFWADYVQWSSDSDIAAVDADGLVTVYKEGTANITASVTLNGKVYAAVCRIDITAGEVSTGFDSVRLNSSKVKSAVFSTNYADLEVLLMLNQNTPASTIIGDSKDDHGVAIMKAVFEDPTTAQYFSLRVADDRKLQVVPTDKAVNDCKANPKALASKYKSSVLVTVKDTDGTEHSYSAGTVTISVDKKVPRIKAKTLTLNSYFNGSSAPIVFTGGKVTEVKLNGEAPSWLTIGTDGTAALTAAGTAASAKLNLLVKAENWNYEFPVTVTIKAKSTVPSITLKVAGNIDTAAPNSAAVATATLKNGKAFAYTWAITDKAGTDFSASFNVTEQNGVFIIKQKVAELAAGSYVLTVSVDTTGDSNPDVSKTAKLTVKASAPAKLKKSVTVKASGKIDPIRPDTAITLTVTFKNCECYAPTASNLTFQKQNGKLWENVDAAKSPFEITETANGYILKVKKGVTLSAADKYAVIFTDTVNGISSKQVKLSIKLGKGKAVLDRKEITLFKADKYCYEVVDIIPADGLSAISKVEIKGKDAALLKLTQVGNTGYRWSIGFPGSITLAKSKTVTLNIWFEGNDTAKPSATVKVKVIVA